MATALALLLLRALPRLLLCPRQPVLHLHARNTHQSKIEGATYFACLLVLTPYEEPESLLREKYFTCTLHLQTSVQEIAQLRRIGVLCFKCDLNITWTAATFGRP